MNGLNNIDTDEAYTTHAEVGEAIKEINLPREDLWITTKISPHSLTNGPLEFVDIALNDLDTEYIDLLLIHSPFLEYGIDTIDVEAYWKEMIQAKISGKVLNTGVSNFAISHLRRLFKVSESDDFFPKVNQIEFHPYLQNQSSDIVQFCKTNDIQLEGYAPLTPLFRLDDKIEHPLKNFLIKLVKKYAKTKAQILLRYTLQKGFIPITTSSKFERISIEIYDFELSDEDVELIDQKGSRYTLRIL